MRIDCSQPTAPERRRLRDGLLARSDWTQLPDAPLSPSLQAQWRAYRQLLRDNPLGPWPSPPTKEST